MGGHVLRSSQLCKVWRSGLCSGRVLAWLRVARGEFTSRRPPLPPELVEGRHLPHKGGDADRQRGAPRRELSAIQTAAKTRIDSAAQKNTSVQYQHLVTFLKLFYPPPPHIRHTVRAALMGPDDHRHSGERAAYGGGRRRRRTLGGDPKPCPSWPSRALKRSAPCASPGKKPYQGVWRATPDYRLAPLGRTARPGLP